MTPRPARFAGRLYPARAERLREAVGRALSGAPGRPDCRLALVPHGSLEACGGVLAAGMNRLAAGVRELVLLGPLHAGDLAGAPLTGDPRSSWETPCGPVELLPARVLDLPVREDPTAQDGEHCLEVLAAWLAGRGEPPRILPLLMAPGLEREPLEGLVEKLQDWLGGEGRALLATTDLDHYHGGPSGRRAHATFLDALGGGDPEELHEVLRSGRSRPCGGGAAWVFTALARRLGRTPRVLAYGWGGPGVGDAVGYAAAVAAAPGDD